jgi:NAD(P)-dependent dehydrogenase (short-subunit alcohol dehydrogenase family)
MTEQRLAERVAIVTGASRGIGRAIAERFAAEGAAVLIDYHTDAAAAQAVADGITARGGRAAPVRADVSTAAGAAALVRAAQDAFGRVDVLVNNAGVHVAKPFLETTEEEWERTIAVNLTGPWRCSKAVVPMMLEQGGGTIINISSNSGLYHPSAMRFTEYVTSKAGLNGMTKALALALGPTITVNAICPGWIRTDMLEEIDPVVHETILAETALRRWGTPDDVAAAAAFLASPDAAFITGELLIVAGGRGMH